MCYYFTLIEILQGFQGPRKIVSFQKVIKRMDEDSEESQRNKNSTMYFFFFSFLIENQLGGKVVFKKKGYDIEISSSN